MRTILTGLLFLAQLAQAEVRLFPSPGLPPSPKFKVEVSTKDGWRESHVNFNQARPFGLGASDQKGRSISWTTFQCDEKVRLRITRLAGPFEEAIVRPLRHQTPCKKTNDRTLELTITPGQKVSIEFDSDIRENCFTGPPHGVSCVIDSILIFSDKIPLEDPLKTYQKEDICQLGPGSHSESLPIRNLEDQKADRALPQISGNKRVVHFLPGVHHLGYWQVPNSVEHIHFSPGAFVYGAIDVLPKGCHPLKTKLKETYQDAWFKKELRNHFQVTGPGILCGSKLPWHLTKDFSFTQDDVYWSHIKLLQIAAERITLNNLTLVDSPYWVLSFLNDTDSRTKGVLDNFKMLGAWTYNNDGLPAPGGQDSNISNAFIHANDDAFKLYQSGARIENCVVWQGPNGASFQLGWFPKTVRDVRVRNIDIIHHENWYGVEQTNRAVINFADAGGDGVIEDFQFTDLRIEGPILRLFDLSPGNGQTIRNFQFKNLMVDSLKAGQPGTRGRNHFKGEISNFRFQNFIVENKPILSPKPAGFLFEKGSGKQFTFEK